MKRLFLIGVLLIAVSFRLYRITNPIADWHSFRQADTASVTHEYVRNGVDLLRPRYHDLSNIQSGEENPSGYRMVEFPFVNGATAAIVTSFSLYEHEALTGRLVSVVFSSLTVLLIYSVGRRLFNENTGVFSALCFAMLPYSVYYGRTILPEPALLFFFMLSLWFSTEPQKQRQSFAMVLSALSFSVALLVKPYALFFLPVVWLASIRFTPPVGRRLLLSTVLLALSVIPLYLWRQWITQFPEGIPASDWLFNKDGIRFTGAFFHWVFEVRFATLILGIGLVFPAVLGILRKGSGRLIMLAWTVCLLGYLFVFAGGNVQHDYYQVIALPFLSVAVGRGVDALLQIPGKIIGPLQMRVLLLALTSFSLFVSWYTVRGYFNVNHWEIVEAGQAADQLLPSEAKIIAPYMGDTAFLYQTRRRGWPIGFQIDEKISLGAQYYVTVNFDDEYHELASRYRTIDKTDRYAILDLQSPSEE